ncbi:VRR-NUC domain-containing protein [Amycolatopsis sp. CA-230715]|uniref:VRR-NUC domain-containing protein n=1 Tax=Amycolatopsis sp. CA-230715 TaxID=2745196 RepID=UPI001C021CC4|nr:VRR-NUC domain-containing protein [Amycolatopsis sp. CA-230715]
MARTGSQREKNVERYLLLRCRESGFLCLKFVSPARGGVPDRIIVTPTVGTVFVEVKRPRGGLARRQRLMHTKIRRFGGEVHVVDSTVAVDELVSCLRRRGSGRARSE